MSSPLTSILIPTYNRREFLLQAIESARRQVYDGPLEIVVLDDHSPDDTADAVRPALGDPRVRYVRHPANVGIAVNWQLGIGQARGAYFCILHDDDVFEPTFVQKLVDPLVANPSLILSFCDHWVMSDNGRRLPIESDVASAQFGRARLPAGPVTELSRVALVDGAVPVGATMFRRSMVTPAMIDPAAQGAIDMWLFYQCARTGAKAIYVPDRLMNYRLHSNNMSSGSGLRLAPGHVYRLETAIVDPMMEPLWPTFRRQLRLQRENHGIALIEAGRPADARQALRVAMVDEVRSTRVRVAWAAAHLGPVGRLIVQLIKRLNQLARNRTRPES